MAMTTIADVRARRADISTLHVFHLGTLLFTDAAFDGATLEARPETERFETTDAATIDDVLAQIEAAGPEPQGSGCDARWGIVFGAASGERILSVYLDAHGAKGTIDGEPVAFEQPTLVAWLRAKYGEDFVLKPA
jgi:hypothetical protein